MLLGVELRDLWALSMKQDLGLVPVLSRLLKHVIWNSGAYGVMGDIVSVVVLRLFAAVCC